MKSLKRFPLIILAVLLFGSTATAQEKQTGTQSAAPIIVYKAGFPITLEGREYDLINMVIDFPAGAGFPKHFHGGHVLVTVLSGEMTLQENGAEKVLKTGQTWTEAPGEEHSIVNKGASARVAASMVLPKGAPETTFVK